MEAIVNERLLRLSLDGSLTTGQIVRLWNHAVRTNESDTSRNLDTLCEHYMLDRVLLYHNNPDNVRILLRMNGYEHLETAIFRGAVRNYGVCNDDQAFIYAQKNDEIYEILGVFPDDDKFRDITMAVLLWYSDVPDDEIDRLRHTSDEEG